VDLGAAHATVSVPMSRSRSCDFPRRVFSQAHTYVFIVQKNSQETLSTEQPIPASANAPHENDNRSEYDYDWIQDFHYCSDDIDWRDKLCKCPVPDMGDSKSSFVSGAISQQGYIERLRVDASRQNGPRASRRRGSLVWAQQGLWGNAWRRSTPQPSAPVAVRI
jgi:hypothetical protein